jgi:hypothetical protein
MRSSPRVSNNLFLEYQNFGTTYGFVHDKFVFLREIVPSAIYIAANDLHAPTNNGTGRFDRQEHNTHQDTNNPIALNC